MLDFIKKRPIWVWLIAIFCIYGGVDVLMNHTWVWVSRDPAADANAHRSFINFEMLYVLLTSGLSIAAGFSFIFLKRFSLHLCLANAAFALGTVLWMCFSKGHFHVPAPLIVVGMLFTVAVWYGFFVYAKKLDEQSLLS